MTVPLIGGGFDPVALPAAEGDTITISVVTSTGRISTYIVVPRRSRPTVVRTSPPKGKRDVALHARITVVFSEPIDPASLIPGLIQLRRGAIVLSGSLTFKDATRLFAEFAPQDTLAPDTDYEVVITSGIRDMDGMPLGAAVSVPFTTGTETVADSTTQGGKSPVATVTLAPNADTIAVGEILVLTPTVRDAAGNILTGRAVTWWYSDDFGIAGVGAGGLVQGIAPGGPVTITAESEGKFGYASVTVTLATPAQLPPGTGSIAVSVVTNGTDLDPDGYTTHVSSGGASTSFPLSINGSATSPTFAAGTYNVMLETAENCTVANGATRQAVVNDDATTAIAFDVTCAPAGQLAFVRNGQIFIARTNGTGAIKLTSSGDNDGPVWSPDGTRIAFTSDRGGLWDIYVMNADGSNVIRLTRTGWSVEPTWSPDGQRIAFQTIGNGSGYVSVVSAAGGGTSATPIVSERGLVAEPAWSRGGQIAYASSGEDEFEGTSRDVYVVNADGSGKTPLLVGPYFDGAFHLRTVYFQPAWSPDGSRIAVNVCKVGYWMSCFPQSTVMVANADGSGLTALAEGGGYSRPTWSPDGRTLAFSRSVCFSCAASLHFVRADGTQEGSILLDGRSPSWRPEQ